MPATIRVIVDEALELVGEVAGVGVQQFSDDRMFHDAIRGFNMMFKKRFWEQFSGWTRVTLDGVTGVITTDAFETVIDFEDFRAVHRAGERSPLPILAKAYNPFTITGTQSLCWTSLRATDANYVKRKLQIYPLAAVGSLDVYARNYPLTPPALQWDWEDTMYLDKDLLVNATAFATLIGDSLNPEAANVAKNLMEMRYANIISALGNHPILIGSEPNIPNQWFVQT